MIHLATSAYKSLTGIFAVPTASVETSNAPTPGSWTEGLAFQQLSTRPENIREATAFSMQLSNLQQSLHRASQPAIAVIPAQTLARS